MPFQSDYTFSRYGCLSLDYVSLRIIKFPNLSKNANDILPEATCICTAVVVSGDGREVVDDAHFDEEPCSGAAPTLGNSVVHDVLRLACMHHHRHVDRAWNRTDCIT